ncbi:hypothetical protein [Clostridium perfringens]|uniref:hypothetical protein n=1 Tax=Clostridium perfringens TaxID=1502 RepID=UPI0024BCD9F8|nr:hypothetical protein [Clostridium perfringens]
MEIILGEKMVEMDSELEKFNTIWDIKINNEEKLIKNLVYSKSEVDFLEIYKFYLHQII